MANKIYFKCKHNNKFIFSSDIFKEPDGKVSIIDPPKISDNPSDLVTIRNYTNIHQVMKDSDMFILLTENSLTKSDLLVLRDALYNFATVDVTGKSFTVREKIDNMIFTGIYLPDDKRKIINK